MSVQLSSYAGKLKKETMDRYKKISLINGVDLFGKMTEGEQFDGYSLVEDCDLVSYFVLRTSFISMSQFKARKGSEAYNQFVSGWIKEVNTRKITGYW